jgi:hypothetical protein
MVFLIPFSKLDKIISFEIKELVGIFDSIDCMIASY